MLGNPQTMPISRSTLSQRVAAAIKNLIIDRSLHPGDKLPSERELSQYFQVSRIVTREALQALTAAGVVRIHHGKGAFVEAFDGKVLMEHLTFGLEDDLVRFKQLLELRVILECGALELAGERATDSDWSKLREIIREMYLAAEQGHMIEELDLTFHRTLLEVSRNAPLSRLGHIITEFFKVRNLAFPPSISFRDLKEEIEEHVRLLAAIERGDVAEAKRLLKEGMLIYQTLAKASNTVAVDTSE